MAIAYVMDLTCLGIILVGAAFHGICQISYEHLNLDLKGSSQQLHRTSDSLAIGPHNTNLKSLLL